MLRKEYKQRLLFKTMKNRDEVILAGSILFVFIFGLFNSNFTGYEVNDCSKIRTDYARADWVAEKSFASLNSDKTRCSKEDKAACRRLEEDYRNWDKTRVERNRLRVLFKECKANMN